MNKLVQRILTGVVMCSLCGACASTSSNQKLNSESAEVSRSGNEELDRTAECLTGGSGLRGVSLFPFSRKAPEKSLTNSQVSIEVYFVKFNLKDIEAVIKRDGSVGVDSLTSLWRKGDGELVNSSLIRGESGAESTVKSVKEYIYPTQFTVTPITGGDTNGSVRILGGVTEPGNFETRESGCTVSLTPIVDAKNQKIRFYLAPEIVSTPDWKDYGSSYTTQGTASTQKMEQPFFRTIKGTTSMTITNGATELICGTVDHTDATKMIYGFITARSLDSAEKTTKK